MTHDRAKKKKWPGPKREEGGTAQLEIILTLDHRIPSSFLHFRYGSWQGVRRWGAASIGSPRAPSLGSRSETSASGRPGEQGREGCRQPECSQPGKRGWKDHQRPAWGAGVGGTPAARVQPAYGKGLEGWPGAGLRCGGGRTSSVCCSSHARMAHGFGTKHSLD